MKRKAVEVNNSRTPNQTIHISFTFVKTTYFKTNRARKKDFFTLILFAGLNLVYLLLHS